MSKTVPLELPSGKVVFAEVDDSASEKDAGWTEMSAGDKKKGMVAESIERLREMLEVTAAGLEKIGPRRPDVVALEMHVELASGGAVKFLAGDAKGGIKVSLTWNTAPAGGP